MFGYLFVLLGPGFLVAGIIGWAERNRFDSAIADYRSPPDRIPIGRWCVFGFGAVLLLGGIVFWDQARGTVLEVPLKTKFALLQVIGIGALLMGAPKYCSWWAARRQKEAAQRASDQEARRKAEQEEEARRNRPIEEAQRAAVALREKAERQVAAERQIAEEEERWRREEEARQNAHLAECNALLATQEEQWRQEEAAKQELAETLEQARRYGAKVKLTRRFGDTELEIVLDPADAAREQELHHEERARQRSLVERKSARLSRVPFPADSPGLRSIDQL